MGFNQQDAKYQEKLRYWKLARGAHKLKNRSSKHLRMLNFGRSIYRCLPTAALQEMANNDNFNAFQEILRRDRKRAKKAS